MSIEQHMAVLALEAMEEYPQAWAQVTRTVRERLHDDADFRLDLKAYTDVPGHVGNPQVEWFYAIQCYTKVLKGDVGTCRVLIGACPKSDSAMKENNKILQRALQPPFYATAIRNFDDDGALGWREPITALRFVKARRNFLIELPPWSAPLEIGYTRGYRSFMHLFGKAALVRWCYDDDFIRVFKLLPHAVDAYHGELAAFFDNPSQMPSAAVVRSAMEQLTLWN